MHQLIFTVHLPHQIGIIIHVTIPKLDRFSAKQKLFSNSFLPQTIREWNKLDTSICQAASYSVFYKALLDFIHPTAKSTIGTNDVSDLKLLARFRVGFSHLREHKFKHNFRDTLNPLCPLSLKMKAPINFLCAANIFLINDITFPMNLMQLTQRF